MPSKPSCLYKEQHLVVLITGTIFPRMGKIGYGLKSIGWRVVLFYRNQNYIYNQDQCFDEMHQYGNAEEAVELASRYNPLIYHIFSVWDYDVAIGMFSRKIGPIVFDNYDMLAGMIKPEFLNTHYDGVLEKEKFCIESADGLCCRDLSLNYARKNLGYFPKGKVIFYPEYCWNFTPKYISRVKSDTKEFHLVYAGGLNVEKLCRNDAYQMQFKNGFFLDFGRELAASGLHFHLYPQPSLCPPTEFENVFSEYLEAQIASPYFHIHRPLPVEKLIEEMASYDMGLEATWQECDTLGAEHSLPIRSYYSMSSKLSDYLEAGLGLVLGDNLKMRRRMFGRHGIVLTAYLDFVKERILSTSPAFFSGLRERVSKVRELYSITRNTPRLADYYLSVAEMAKQRKPPMKAVPPSPVENQIHEAIEYSLSNTFEGLLRMKDLMGSKISTESPPPTIFCVETMLGCDLRCPECAIGGGIITRPRGYMTFEQFTVIADKIRPYCQYLYLHLWGEPLLNRDIIPIIKYASQFTSTNISTNGMCLTPQLAEELITSGVTDILFSIDGMSQETYQQYRVGGDINKAIAALKMLHYFNKKHSSRVNIIPQYIVFKHNQHEMPAFQTFCRLFGMEASFKAPYIRKDSHYANADCPEYVRTAYGDMSSLKQAMSTCQDSKHVLTILLDGSAVACCYDHNADLYFGNIFQNNVMEIWNSPSYKRFRERMHCADPPQFCLENCLQYLLGEAQASKKGKRSKTTIDVSNLQRALEYARDKYRTAEYPECFDVYEQIVHAYPQIQIELLAEIFDQYRPLESQGRYHLYQSRFFEFDIKTGDKVLDIGSGHLPFPFATHLADIALEDCMVGRAGIPFKYVDGKPVYECNLENLPFADNEFDFIYCSHVLEHVENPEKACKELMRVAKRGYIETPNRGKDLWLNTTKISNHKWAVELYNRTLIFTEYTQNEVEGLSCGILLDMHCNPQTGREIAVSALVNLKADLLNTMLYWEDDFTYEVRRVTHSTEEVKISNAPASTTENRKKYLCVFLNTYYDGFLKKHYSSNQDLVNTSYSTQHASLQKEMFGDSDFYSKGLECREWQAIDLIVNCSALQQTWALENKIQGSELAIAVEQIRSTRPDVLYIQDMHLVSAEFIDAIRPYSKLVVGQIASPVEPQMPLNHYDIIFTSFPHYVERFRQKEITTYYQPLAFEPRLIETIPYIPFKSRPIDCSFVGGISSLHTAGTKLLENLVVNTSIRLWGYGAEVLPENSAIRRRHNGEAWGLEMFTVLASSQITVNRHVDVAENYANNMRLFEATGCGALLITDYKDNLNELFEIGKEVVVYRSPKECAALVNYYLEHADEAEVIAKAGQARTLRDHTYTRRMAHTAEILTRHLRYKDEQKKLPNLDSSNISYGHTLINAADVTTSMTSAWRNQEIPARQRALVQHELNEMYHGNIAIPFKVLSNILQPVVDNSSSILEIGCASGYYYEILEYLLSRCLTYTGVDYSEAMIEMAKDYYPGATFFAADGANLFFTNRQFSIVISSCVLLHVPNWRQHVFETVRVAKNHVVVSRTPVCKNSPTRYMKKYAYGVETVELQFNEAEFVREFLLNGLELVDAIQYHANPADDAYETTYLFKRAM